MAKKHCTRITQCVDCPEHEWSWSKNVFYCLITRRTIKNYNSIPIWCPLEEWPEKEG